MDLGTFYAVFITLKYLSGFSKKCRQNIFYYKNINVHQICAMSIDLVISKGTDA